MMFVSRRHRGRGKCTFHAAVALLATARYAACRQGVGADNITTMREQMNYEDAVLLIMGEGPATATSVAEEK
jgi:hypothetical protein